MVDEPAPDKYFRQVWSSSPWLPCVPVPCSGWNHLHPEHQDKANEETYGTDMIISFNFYLLLKQKLENNTERW